MSINLDDYDKVPCSAKEARKHMEDGGVAVSSYTPEIVRIFECRLEYFDRLKQSHVFPPLNAEYMSPIAFMSADWFKLVPKKKEEEIKQCPFHGKACELSIERDDKNEKTVVADCDAKGPQKPSREEAIRSWNTRAFEAKPDRLAAINLLIQNRAKEIDEGDWNQDDFICVHRAFARAVVELIEGEKK